MDMKLFITFQCPYKMTKNDRLYNLTSYLFVQNEYIEMLRKL